MTLSLLIPGVGMGGGAAAVSTPWILQRANKLVGDHWQEEIYYREQPITGYTVLLLDSSGAAVTTGTTNVYVTKDGGTQAAATTATATHEGQGAWSLDLTTVEMDAEVVSLTITNSGAVPVHIVINTKG